MKIEVTLTIDIEEDKLFNKNNPDEVIYFLETIMSHSNLILRSKLTKRSIGNVVAIKDIIEV
jgi:hypothetical protein